MTTKKPTAWHILDDLRKSVVCPCCEANNELYSLSCGHLVCRVCLHKRNFSPAKDNRPNHQHKCPICQIYSTEICPDELINSLAVQTVHMIETITESTKQVSCNKENDVVLSHTYEDDVEKKPQTECKDQTQQTERVATQSVSIQCNRNNKSEQMNSISTQTDSIPEVPSCCCKADLVKILQSNICEPLNAIIKSLHQSKEISGSGSKSQTDDSQIQSVEKQQTDIQQIPSESKKSPSSSLQDPSATAGVVGGREIAELPKKRSLRGNRTISAAIENSHQMLDSTVRPNNSVSIENVLPNSDSTEEDFRQEKVLKPLIPEREILKNSKDNKKSKKVKIEEIESTSSSTRAKRMKTDSNNPIRKPERSNNTDSTDGTKALDNDDKSTSKSKTVNRSKKKKQAVAKESASNMCEQGELFKEPEVVKKTKRPTKEKVIRQSMESVSCKEKSDTSVASGSRSRARSSSNEKRTYVIMTAGLDSIQKGKFENLANSLDLEVASSWTSKVTHLVVGFAKDSLKKDMLTTRSMKYLTALLGHRWIVSFDWVIASLSSNRMVDELKYEMRGVRNCKQLDCPKQSRLEKKPFFADHVIYFNRPFVKFCGSMNDLETLVSTGGGTVVNSLDELSAQLKKRGASPKLVVVNDNDDRTTSTCTTALHIPINEFIDCATNLQNL